MWRPDSVGGGNSGGRASEDCSHCTGCEGGDHGDEGGGRRKVSGRVEEGRATTSVGCDVGSIPTCGALEVWQWTFGSRTVWLVNKSAGLPQFIFDTLFQHNGTW